MCTLTLHKSNWHRKRSCGRDGTCRLSYRWEGRRREGKDKRRDRTYHAGEDATQQAYATADPTNQKIDQTGQKRHKTGPKARTPASTHCAEDDYPGVRERTYAGRDPAGAGVYIVNVWCVCMYTYIIVYMYTMICIYKCIYIHTRVCVHTYLHAHTHIHTNTHTHTGCQLWDMENTYAHTCIIYSINTYAYIDTVG
jgi:hypothetical protein